MLPERFASGQWRVDSVEHLAVLRFAAANQTFDHHQTGPPQASLLQSNQALVNAPLARREREMFLCSIFNRPLAVCLLLLGFIVTLMAEPQSSVTFSKESSALKLAISSLEPQYTNTPPAFLISITNMGDTYFKLNLGIMLGNGLYPTAIRLMLDDSEGNSKELHFCDPCIAGRVDDYIVPLRAGSTYILKMSMTDFWYPKGPEWPLNLKPGVYRIGAQLDSRGIQHINSGEEGKLHMDVWKGTLRSETTTFTMR